MIVCIFVGIIGNLKVWGLNLIEVLYLDLFLIIYLLGINCIFL